MQVTDLTSVIFDLSNPKFTDLLAISGFLYGTGVWEDNGENLYGEGISLQEMITNREDVYTYLRSKLDEECCGDPSGEAYDIMQKVRYLTSKTRCITILKKNIYSYLIEKECDDNE